MSLFPVFLYLSRFLFVWRARRPFFSFRVVFFYLVTTGWIFLKKNLNASRLSDHPPVREKNVKTFISAYVKIKSGKKVKTFISAYVRIQSIKKYIEERRTIERRVAASPLKA